jgi:hypothetical protein
MSKRMLETFFPAVTDSLGKSWLGHYVHHVLLFPDAVAEACPEYSVGIDITTTSTIVIRSPVLLLATLWGMWIGGNGFRNLRGLWAHAFLAFGMMNLSAMFLHCLWPSVSTNETYATTYPLLWVMDTYMTGFSSGCLLWASLLHHQPQQQNALQDPQQQEAILSKCVHCVGVACILWFLADPVPKWVAKSHPLELWYLLPPLLAGLPVLSVVFRKPLVWVWRMHPPPPQGVPQNNNLKKGGASSSSPSTTADAPWCWTRGQVIFGLGATCAGVLGIGLDRWWCHLFGGNSSNYRYIILGDLMTATTLTFLGCDLCFWGMELCSREDGDTTNNTDVGHVGIPRRRKKKDQ